MTDTIAIFPETIHDKEQNPLCDYIIRGDYYDCVHNAGGRGMPFEKCCFPCRTLIYTCILTMGSTINHHDSWCGYNVDSPGNSIVNRAKDAFNWIRPWAEYHIFREVK